MADYGTLPRVCESVINEHILPSKTWREMGVQEIWILNPDGSEGFQKGTEGLYSIWSWLQQKGVQLLWNQQDSFSTMLPHTMPF